MPLSDILWLIAARSGSKSIPDKNVKPLGGIPLVAYKIKTALKISEPSDVWLSTDTEQYAEVGRRYGANVPFLRPDRLASDEASSIDVVLHAMQFAEENAMRKKFIGLLEPTSPFVYADLIEDALTTISENEEAQAIVATRETRPNTIFIQDQSKYLEALAENLTNLKNLGRQLFAKQITPSGGFYISRWESFKSQKSFYTSRTLAYNVPSECELEIDEPMDWLMAEFFLEKQIIDLKRLI